MTPFGTLSSRLVCLPLDDVDTDQIIPARYLKGTDKLGFGAHLFADWQSRPGFPLRDARAKGAEILFVGNNFGCGSSREHAPWALVGAGFRAVVARSFADIFRQNALKNGLLPIALGEAAHGAIRAAYDANPDVTLTVDLAGERVSIDGGAAYSFPIDAFAKHCLLQGVDELGYLLSLSPEIDAYEARTEGAAR
jgi:3-isopropylmalate/(R)-2-methylmalate dehydratase small subunit